MGGRPRSVTAWSTKQRGSPLHFLLMMNSPNCLLAALLVLSTLDQSMSVAGLPPAAATIGTVTGALNMQSWYSNPVPFTLHSAASSPLWSNVTWSCSLKQASTGTEQGPNAKRR